MANFRPATHSFGQQSYPSAAIELAAAAAFHKLSRELFKFAHLFNSIILIFVLRGGIPCQGWCQLMLLSSAD